MVRDNNDINKLSGLIVQTHPTLLNDSKAKNTQYKKILRSLTTVRDRRGAVLAITTLHIHYLLEEIGYIERHAT